MNAFEVLQPGLLSLLHDRGRFGQAALGLTTGGPADPFAASLANQLVGNGDDATILEISFGGLAVRAQQSLQVAVTGAELPITIDGKEQPQWTTLSIDEGQELSLGFSEKGCRSYLAVRGGFAVDPQFGSTSTVVREGIGGLSGQKLNAGDELEVNPSEEVTALMVPKASIGDRVWADMDRDGLQDAGEPGFPDVTVTLMEADGTVVDSVTRG